MNIINKLRLCKYVKVIFSPLKYHIQIDTQSIKDLMLKIINLQILIKSILQFVLDRLNHKRKK